MAVKVTNVRSAASSGSLGIGQCGEGLLVRVEVDGLFAEPGGGSGGAVDCKEEGRAEVLRDRVCRTAAAAGAPDRALPATEEALESVGRRGDAGVVEAREEVLVVAFGERGDVVDKLPSRCAETSARRGGLQSRDLRVQAGLRFGRVLRPVRSLGVCGELVRDLAEDPDVAVHAPGDADLVPVRGEGL